MNNKNVSPIRMGGGGITNITSVESVKNQKIKKVVSSMDEIKNGSERKMMLYSRLPRTREQNPERYDNLVSFWSLAITQLSQDANLLIFTPNQLQDAFKVDGISPISLFEIIEQIEKKEKTIITIQEFNTVLNGWSWFWNRVAVPTFQWSWSWVAGGGGGGKDSGATQTSLSVAASPRKGGSNASNPWAERKLIVKSVVLEKAETLYYSQIESAITSEPIVSLAKLESILGQEQQLTRDEIALLVGVLIREGRAAYIVQGDQVKGVKFALDGQKVVAMDSDYGVLKLQATYDMLLAQEKSLMDDIKATNAKISEYIAVKQKNNALHHLKKKKKLESILETRTQQSNNIHDVLMSIESANSNQQVVDALCVGVGTLKKVNEKMTVDQVYQVMDDFEEAMTDQKEIDEAIKTGMTASSNINYLSSDEEEQLEKELEQMETDLFTKDLEKLTLSNSNNNTPIKNQETTTTTTTTTTEKTKEPIVVEQPKQKQQQEGLFSKEDEELLESLMKDAEEEFKEKQDQEEKKKEKELLPA
ncbi:SNF7 family protein [Cavenderia fasciculata]|uniref:SNF7 family protein n=1 Tax=Cavenderia fasciculata TaxID=261658 RepID=F4Q5B8_CACFS|nr:SNF7 family protein [Cavenderia fasciculata]EGG17177.1 SNF7 family protein [Cavenderia fasciculata]|eukprot:XP_004355661.1 SNF7 family protein [Cavenderia fasciculata]